MCNHPVVQINCWEWGLYRITWALTNSVSAGIWCSHAAAVVWHFMRYEKQCFFVVVKCSYCFFFVVAIPMLVTWESTTKLWIWEGAVYRYLYWLHKSINRKSIKFIKSIKFSEINKMKRLINKSTMYKPLVWYSSTWAGSRPGYISRTPTTGQRRLCQSDV